MTSRGFDASRTVDPAGAFERSHPAYSGTQVVASTAPAARPDEPILGSPHDPAEREADRVAVRVIAELALGSGAAPEVPRATCGRLLRCTAPDVGAARSSGQRAPSGFMQRVRHEQANGGHSLAPGLRAPMEHAFASDFSGVKVHADDRGARLAGQAHARAFAVGDDVFFDRGAFKPHDPRGQRLLAHELAHVVQARSSRETTIRRSPGDVPHGPAPAFEVGDFLTGEQFLQTVQGIRLIVPGAVAMRISGDGDGHLVVPLSALEYDRDTPTTDKLHRNYMFRETNEGRLWANKLEQAADRQRTAQAAAHIGASWKPIAAFGVIGGGAALGFGLGLWAGGLSLKLGAVATGVVGGAVGGAAEGAVTGAGLSYVEGGDGGQMLSAAGYGAALGGGAGLFLGGLGGLVGPGLRNRFLGGPERAAFADEVAETGYSLPKPSLSGRSARMRPPAPPATRVDVQPYLPLRKVATDSDYVVEAGFRRWRGFEYNEIPVQSWKLHVSATPDNASAVAQTILPELRLRGIPHKVPETIGVYREMIDDGQGGKFVTVYPRSLKEARALRVVLGRKLRANDFRGKKHFLPVAEEASMGTTGGVYMRYGAHLSIKVEGIEGLAVFKTNALGQAVDPTGNPVLYNGGPINLGEPLNVSKKELNSIIELLKHKGVPLPDPRGKTVRPDWAPALE